MTTCTEIPRTSLQSMPRPMVGVYEATKVDDAEHHRRYDRGLGGLSHLRGAVFINTVDATIGVSYVSYVAVYRLIGDASLPRYLDQSRSSILSTSQAFEHETQHANAKLVVIPFSAVVRA